MRRYLGIIGILLASTMALEAGAQNNVDAALARRTAAATRSTGVVCVSSNGTIRTRTRCVSGETKLSGRGLGISAGVPGSTATGAVGGTFSSSVPGSWSALGSLPAKATKTLAAADIILVSSDGSQSGNAASTCTGSAAAPTAPQGKLCIYSVGTTNAAGISATPVPATGSEGAFEVSWTAPTAGATSFIAVWAYTSPSPSVSANGTPKPGSTPKTPKPSGTRKPWATRSPQATANTTPRPSASPSTGPTSPLGTPQPGTTAQPGSTAQPGTTATSVTPAVTPTISNSPSSSPAAM